MAVGSTPDIPAVQPLKTETDTLGEVEAASATEVPFDRDNPGGHIASLGDQIGKIVADQDNVGPTLNIGPGSEIADDFG